MGFTVTSEQILWVCSFLGGLWGVWKIVKELKKPSDDLRNMVRNHEQKLNNDNERLNNIEEQNKMILQSMLVIINHEITGNGVENMKKTRDEIQEYLINRISK